MHPSIELFTAEMESCNAHFPKAQLPPNCSVLMEPEYLEYESRLSLKISFPVKKEYLNPMLGMQGGFIAAAFDNVFGPLSYLAARIPCTTLDLNTNYIRPIAEKDSLIVTARVVSRGQSTMHLAAEAVNGKGKLIATCSTHMMIMK
ncbi:MAG: PaaI family thioesterase [Bacteroidota bacterium]